MSVLAVPLVVRIRIVPVINVTRVMRNVVVETLLLESVQPRVVQAAAGTQVVRDTTECYNSLDELPNR